MGGMIRMETRMKIWYLYHSGFAVETPGHFLVFDYWRDTPKGGGLDEGVIDPGALRDKDLVVFASHRHGDHFNRAILDLPGQVPKTRLILSDDIRGGEGAVRLGPGQSLEMPDLRIRTFASNDEGVAFLVELDGLRIYHAGDLNWWHWEGEPEEDNSGMESSYKAQIALLGETAIDLAFVVLDPRQEGQYAWGFDHFLRHVDVRHVVPMHFGDAPEVVGQLLGDPVSAPYRDKVIGLTRRGQSAEV